MPPDTLGLPGRGFTLRVQISTWGLPGLRRRQHGKLGHHRRIGKARCEMEIHKKPNLTVFRAAQFGTRNLRKLCRIFWVFPELAFPSIHSLFRTIRLRSVEHVQRLQTDSYVGVTTPRDLTFFDSQALWKVCPRVPDSVPSPTAPRTSSQPGSWRSWGIFWSMPKEQLPLDLTSAGWLRRETKRRSSMSRFSLRTKVVVFQDFCEVDANQKGEEVDEERPYVMLIRSNRTGIKRRYRATLRTCENDYRYASCSCVVRRFSQLENANAPSALSEFPCGFFDSCCGVRHVRCFSSPSGPFDHLVAQHAMCVGVKRAARSPNARGVGCRARPGCGGERGEGTNRPCRSALRGPSPPSAKRSTHDRPMCRGLW